MFNKKKNLKNRKFYNIVSSYFLMNKSYRFHEQSHQNHKLL